jgi:hypothetical protein
MVIGFLEDGAFHLAELPLSASHQELSRHAFTTSNSLPKNLEKTAKEGEILPSTWLRKRTPLG